MRRLACLILPCLAACSGARGASGGMPAPPCPPDWKSALHCDHPLAGKVWHVPAARFADLGDVEAAAARADLALLGETHDNPDHQRLEARLVRAVAATGRRPALAVEMLEVDQQAAVDAALSGGRADADALAGAVGWSKSGWPAFERYRPVFAAALEAGMPIVAANLSHPLARAAIERGPGALPAPIRALLERRGPATEEEARALRREMQEQHCGELPESLLDPMVLVQRARDAQMAERLAAAGERGAVLVAGAGHVRADRGAPAFVELLAPRRTAISVAFLEVSPGKLEPGDYASDYDAPRLPFDYVIFTPAAEREDPCLKLRRRPIRNRP